MFTDFTAQQLGVVITMFTSLACLVGWFMNYSIRVTKEMEQLRKDLEVKITALQVQHDGRVAERQREMDNIRDLVGNQKEWTRVNFIDHNTFQALVALINEVKMNLTALRTELRNEIRMALGRNPLQAD